MGVVQVFPIRKPSLPFDTLDKCGREADHSSKAAVDHVRALFPFLDNYHKDRIEMRVTSYESSIRLSDSNWGGSFKPFLQISKDPATKGTHKDLLRGEDGNPIRVTVQIADQPGDFENSESTNGRHARLRILCLQDEEERQ